MEWAEIVAALALTVFIVVMFPVAKNMVQNSPKGTSSDWMGFVLIMGLIVLFVVLLIRFV